MSDTAGPPKPGRVRLRTAQPCEEPDVANPWTKKNPLLSMWLSGANAVAGKARSAGTAEVRRQQTGLAKQAARFWGGGSLGATKPKAKPKRRR
jgi:hypothetical protein